MTPVTDIPEGALDWARPLYAVQITDMSELAQMGMELAREVRTGVEADPVQTVQIFAKVSRSVRLTYMLQAKLIKDLEDRDKGLIVPEAKPEPQRRTIQRVIVEPVWDEDGNLLEPRIVDPSEIAEARERRDRERLDREALDRDTGFVLPKSFPAGEGGPTAQRLGDGASEPPPGAPGKTPSTAFRGPPPPTGEDLSDRPPDRHRYRPRQRPWPG